MMQCGYLRNVSGRAEPNWLRLGDDLGDDFFGEAVAAAPTVVDDPPKKLVVTRGQAAFGGRPPPATNTAQLLQFVRQVRNNLFHGNKMFAANRQRDELLMIEVLAKAWPR